MQHSTETSIDPKKTALLLLHWQNDMASPAGKSAQDMPERIKAAHTIEYTQAVLEATRKKEIPVIYVNAAHRPGYPEMPTGCAPLSTMLAERGVGIKGTWGAEVIDELKPLSSEIIVDNSSTSGFCYTDLDLILRNKGITDIVLSGVATNFAVESTARDGFNMGYRVFTLKDCCISLNDKMHNWTITNIFPVIGWVIDSNTYIAALQRTSS